MLAAQNVCWKEILVDKEVPNAIPLAEMDDIRDRLGIPRNLAGHIVLGQKRPSLSTGHFHVGNHHSTCHLMPQSQVCRRHAVPIHFCHELRVVFENPRQELCPLVTDSKCVPCRHPVRRSRGKDKLGINVGNLVDRTVWTNDFVEMIPHVPNPIGTERIILCRGVTLRDFSNELIFVAQLTVVFVPLVQGHVRKIVDKGLLHEHVRID
mmetsp:Transcript_640/g.1457  ORF Transcript_640/g.1457 Transcript_640/m.1457 type:complete len:208 (+) Transcript_640:521-1144(+)